jgi:hypothetical protein
MSLEAALEANTAALAAMTVELQKSNAGRAAAVEAITAAEGAKGATRGRPAGSKNKEDPAPGAAASPPPPPAAAAAATSGEPMTIEAFRAEAGKFMSVEDEAVKATRKEFIRSINDHLGVAKVVEVKDSERGQVIAWLEEFLLTGGPVDFSAGEGGAEAQVEEDDGIG